jgi:hypothetical protein
MTFDGKCPLRCRIITLNFNGKQVSHIKDLQCDTCYEVEVDSDVNNKI